MIPTTLPVFNIQSSSKSFQQDANKTQTVLYVNFNFKTLKPNLQSISASELRKDRHKTRGRCRNGAPRICTGQSDTRASYALALRFPPVSLLLPLRVATGLGDPVPASPPHLPPFLSAVILEVVACFPHHKVQLRSVHPIAARFAPARGFALAVSTHEPTFFDGICCCIPRNYMCGYFFLAYQIFCATLGYWTESEPVAQKP